MCCVLESACYGWMALCTVLQGCIFSQYASISDAVSSHPVSSGLCTRTETEKKNKEGKTEVGGPGVGVAGVNEEEKERAENR